MTCVLLILALLVVGSSVGKVAQPSLLTNLSISARSSDAVVSWEGPGTEFVIDWSTNAAMRDASSLITAEHQAILTGLMPETQYFVRVRAEKSELSAVFTTGEAIYRLQAPELKLSQTDNVGIEATWKVRSDAEVEVQISLKTDFSKNTSQFTNSKSVIFDGLEKATTYHIRARFIDASRVPLSDWSESSLKTADAEQPLRVGSYNVRRQVMKYKYEKNWKTRCPLVVDIIKSQDIDIMGVQEAYQYKLKGLGLTQYQYLMQKLGSPYKPTTTTQIRNNGVGVIYNTERLTLIEQGTKNLEAKRYLVWGIFEQKSTGKRFVFGSTHLTAGHAKKHNALRNRQSKSAISTLKSVAGELPIIFTGDMNTYFHSRGGNSPYATFTANFLDPLGSEKNAGIAKAEIEIGTRYSTYNAFERKARTSGTYMDYILVTPMRVSEWETVVELSYGRFPGTIPSDHNMVRATVWLP